MKCVFGFVMYVFVIYIIYLCKPKSMAQEILLIPDSEVTGTVL